MHFDTMICTDSNAIIHCDITMDVPSNVSWNIKVVHTGVISTKSSEHNMISTGDTGYGDYIKTSHSVT